MAIPLKKGAASNQKEASSKSSSQVGGADAFAERFNNAEGKPLIGVQPGLYEMKIIDGVYEQDKDSQKEAAYFELEVQNDDEGNDGKTCRIYYNFVDKDGNMQPGFDFLARDLNTMGMRNKIKDRQDLEILLKEVVDAEKVVRVQAKQNKKDKQYVNYYVQGVID